MVGNRKAASPVLGAAMSAIGSASEALVPSDSRFRHSIEVKLSDVRPDPEQPRRHFDPAEIQALATTMQAEGQLQPVLLRRDPVQRGQWILVAGERRWRAAQLNGWPSLLAIEHAGDAEIAALLENLQRVDLTPVEAAQGIRRLLSSKGISQARAATLLGSSPAEISATLRLLTLPEEFLERAGHLPRNLLVELARLEDGAIRQRLLHQALAGTLTIRAIRAAQAGAVRPEPSSSSEPLAALERAIARLERQHHVGRRRPEEERAALRALRQRIDALLKF
ncbi:ParB/RepB/Spo0J family partition protein [Pseudoroseomonas globiformis]|uniref:ParB/RepB/Spo0J family partition protein n=1 Tax=Teichococcus globiformis TaxID=2307229 RepID=A0ABV7G3N3_9PROT